MPREYKSIQQREWMESLICNGEIMAHEMDWKTPNTYSNNFDYPENCPGIYCFVVYTSTDDQGNVVYIGSSKNLKQRYTGHPIKAALYQGYWYVRFYFFECEDYKKREKELIQKFKPKYNIQHKGNRSLNFNLIFNG